MRVGCRQSESFAHWDKKLMVSSRTHGRAPFLCLSKEKGPKETTPGSRLFPPLLVCGGSCPEGLPLPSGNARGPTRAPYYGLSPAANSGARRGKRATATDNH